MSHTSNVNTSNMYLICTVSVKKCVIFQFLFFYDLSLQRSWDFVLVYLITNFLFADAFCCGPVYLVQYSVS